MSIATRSSALRAHSLEPRLRRAFLETRYEAAGAVARIGRRSTEIDGLLLRLKRREGVFLTGCNPRSRRMPEGWNRRMQIRLVEAMRRLAFVPGHGTGSGWREEHMLVLADPRRALVLAWRFRQRAVVLVRLRQPARLVVLRR
jgi:Protein of unknown function (DUF3293)